MAWLGLFGLFGLGKATAKNTIEANVKALVNVVNNSSQKCVNHISQGDFLKITAKDGAKINIGGDWNQVIIFEANCVQNVTFNTNVTQQLSLIADQQAKAISEFFALGKADAENIMKLNQELAIQIGNTVAQICYNDVTQTIGTELNLGNNAEINFFPNISQYNQSMVNCVLNNNSITNTNQKIELALTQAAEAKALGVTSLIWGIIIIIISVIALFIFGFLLLTSHKGGKEKITQEFILPNQNPQYQQGQQVQQYSQAQPLRAQQAQQYSQAQPLRAQQYSQALPLNAR